jgi:peptide deformylase
MIKPILKYPHPLLLDRIPPVLTIDPASLEPVVDDLLDTARSDARCLGLAANQIGYSSPLFVVKTRIPGAVVRDGWSVVLNPNICGTSRERCVYERCMSFPQVDCEVRRPDRVRVEFRNLTTGAFASTELRGLDAQTFVHETDHLRGRTILNAMDGNARAKFEAYLKAMKWGQPEGA